MVIRKALSLVLLGVVAARRDVLPGTTLRAFLSDRATDTVSLAVSVSMLVAPALVACAVPLPRVAESILRRAARRLAVVALRVD